VSAISKRKAGGKKKEKVEHAEPKVVPRPTAVVPHPTVETRHGTAMIERSARGYSQGEVTRAGLSVAQARSWRVPVDDRRRSVLDGNVSQIKKWAAHAKPVTVVGKVEGEVKKIEKAVKKEVQRAEKEVEKVEKEVERVEKKVVKKVEAPVKARTKKKAAKKPKSTDE